MRIDMELLWIALAILAGLFLLYMLTVMGRHGHPGMAALRGFSYAHRGLHGNGRPENSMAAFRAALERGYGIELDLHLLKDGNLAVIHDHPMIRTTGAEGVIENLSTGDLAHYRLEGTQETIPTFRQVLELFDGKAPIIVELKSAGSNYKALVDAAAAQLQDYAGPYCIESFDPQCIFYLRTRYPKIIRGQLTQNFVKGKAKLPYIIKFAMTHQLLNFLLYPDFVAYRFSDRKTLGNFLVRKLWRTQGVAWTLKSQAAQDTAVREGWLPIFEGYEP